MGTGFYIEKSKGYIIFKEIKIKQRVKIIELKKVKK